MNNHDNRELDRLLTCDTEDLLATITPMSADDCEHYARSILDRIGGPTFEQYLMRITETMVPLDESGPPTKPDDYYFAVRDFFPNVSLIFIPSGLKKHGFYQSGSYAYDHVMISVISRKS